MNTLINLLEKKYEWKLDKIDDIYNRKLVLILFLENEIELYICKVLFYSDTSAGIRCNNGDEFLIDINNGKIISNVPNNDYLLIIPKLVNYNICAYENNNISCNVLVKHFLKTINENSLEIKLTLKI